MKTRLISSAFKKNSLFSLSCKLVNSSPIPGMVYCGFCRLVMDSLSGRRGGLMVSALYSGASAPGSSPGWGHCVVFLGKSLYSHGASLHPGV